MLCRMKKQIAGQLFETGNQELSPGRAAANRRSSGDVRRKLAGPGCSLSPVISIIVLNFLVNFAIRLLARSVH